MKSSNLIFFLLAIVAANTFACRSTSKSEAGRDESKLKTFASDPLLCNKPKRVEFSGFEQLVGPVKSVVEKGFEKIDFKVSASDIAKAGAIVCKDNGECTTALNKEIQLGQPFRTTVVAKLILDFQQDFDGKGQICMRKVKVGTVVQPLCIQKFLKVGVEIGVQVTQKIGETKTTITPEVYCTASMECSLPFFSFSMRINKNGLEFGEKATMSGFGNFQLAKIKGAGSSKQTFGFDELPAVIQKIKDKAIEAAVAPAGPDIEWENFAKRCNDNFGDLQ